MGNLLGRYSKKLKKSLVVLFVVAQCLTPVVAKAGYNSWAEIVSSGKEATVVEIGNAAIKQGFNYESTIGVMANINSESGFDSSAIEGGNGIGRGLIQWSFERRTAMENFIQQKYNGDFGSMEGQMAYLNYEITETDWKGEMNEATVKSQLAAYGLSVSSKIPNSWDEFKQLTNAEDAAKIFMVVMERPSYDPGTNHWEQRVRLAKEMAEGLKGKLNGSSSSGKKEEGKSKGETVEADGNLPKEYELVGMSKRNYLYESQLPIVFPGQEIAGETGLSESQQYNVASIKESVGTSNKFNWIDFLRVCVAFVGIWFFVWGIGLIVAYLFDRSNIYLELSLVSVLTGGTITVLALDEGDVRRANVSMIVRRVVLAFVVGYILVAGMMYIGLGWLFQFVQGLINNL